MIVYTCPQCGSDLQEQLLPALPPIHKKICHNCGWTHEERQNIIKIPYVVPYVEQPAVKIEYTDSSISNIPPACKYCSNHPINGGSGICHCINGIMTVT